MKETKKFGAGIYIPMTPRFPLRMRPILTFILGPDSQDETFYEGEMTYQPQLRPRQATVDAFNHDKTVLLTTSMHPSSAVVTSPPPTPRQPNGEEDNLITCLPVELYLPMLC
jgi:hypothetical protein